MGMQQNNDGKTMEGWLYTIRSNRFGLQFSRKRYFVLEDNCLKCYKSIPGLQREEPVKSAIIDSCIRVTDNGRESIHRKVFFIFSLYSTLNHNDHLKLGANSPEDAAQWIHSLQNAATKECANPAKDLVAIPKRKWPPLRLSVTKRSTERKLSLEHYSSLHAEAMTSDVIAPSPWKIFGCQNGLRLFKEAKDWDSRGRHWEDHPAIMAVGVVDGTSEAIFRTLMSLGASRSEWDFCFYRGIVVEHLDGHTDIIHKQLYSDWLPWSMSRRDLLLRRYWRREDDGTYVILYHSVIHKRCPPRKGYVRARVKSGGYVVTPVNQGRQSLVKHMLAIDWKSWKYYMHPPSARSITIHMLERVAALRELFRAKSGNYPSDFSFSEAPRHNISAPITKEVKTILEGAEKTEESAVALVEDEAEKLASERTSLMGLHDASDEFFDVPDANELVDLDHLDGAWSTENIVAPRLSSASVLVKKLHDLAVQKKGYIDLQQESARDDGIALPTYGATLQKDPSCTLPCSWTTADPTTFLIRGGNYLKDHQKIKAKGTLMQMVGADWLRSDQREDDLGGRPDSIVQKYAAQDRPEFFFIINIQVPAGSTMYSLAFYYMLKTPLEETPLLHKFVSGDNAYRNSRFKLIPHISKGPWIVKQSVGKKACLLGHALEVNYFRGKNYLELGLDVGSSTVARGVVSLVLGYLNNLVIQMAFLIQSNTEEELPEVLLGTCRLNNLDASKSVIV